MYHYAGNNPIRYVDPTGRLDEDGFSDKKTDFSQRIENYKNGFGFRTTQQIREYNSSEEGLFARQAIDELYTTEWSQSETGQKVMAGLEDAYKRGRIFIGEMKVGGYQLFWGKAAYIKINKNDVNNYMLGTSKNAMITLAHEGSHYTYATRNGIWSGWWFEYEIEGYRITDYLNLEIKGRCAGGSQVREVHTIEKWLNTNNNYRWIPSYKKWTKKQFNYWNMENVGK